MSKSGRKCRRWHYQRIEREFDRKPEIIIAEMFEFGTAITVIAGALGISYGEMHEWIQELGLEREPISRSNRHLTKERLLDKYGTNAIQLICSERANGATYEEIKTLYNVSSGFIADCLREGAPWLIGTPDAPITVRPPNISATERARRSTICIKHNRQMKDQNRGWFQNHHEICRK